MFRLKPFSLTSSVSPDARIYLRSGAPRQLGKSCRYVFRSACSDCGPIEFLAVNKQNVPAVLQLTPGFRRKSKTINATGMAAVENSFSGRPMTASSRFSLTPFHGCGLQRLHGTAPHAAPRRPPVLTGALPWPTCEVKPSRLSTLAAHRAQSGHTYLPPHCPRPICPTEGRVGDNTVKPHQPPSLNQLEVFNVSPHSSTASSMPWRNMFIFASASVLPFS